MFELFVAILGAIMGAYFGSLYSTKTFLRSHHQASIDLLILNARDLGDHVTEYFVNPGETRDLFIRQGMILARLRDISSDLQHLVNQQGGMNSEYIAEINRFKRTLTSEPFGSEIFQPLSPNDIELVKLREGIDIFVRYLRTLKPPK